MSLAINDPVQFFPFDPTRRVVHVRNPPIEGRVVAVLRRYYRVRLACGAPCTVAKTNPTLAAAPTSS